MTWISSSSARASSASRSQSAPRHAGRKVTVIDRRHHIGGNAYSEDEPETGIEVHRYGAHLFHTSNPTRLGVRQPLHDVHELRAPGLHEPQGRRVPAADQPRHDQPVLPGRRTRPTRRKALIHELAGEFDVKDAANLEEKGIALIGRPLYEAFIRDYTAKQWQTDPEGPARRGHQPPAGALQLRQPLLQRHVGGPADRRLHRVDRADGGSPEHRGPSSASTSSTSRSRSTRRRPSGSSRSSTPARSTATSTTPRARCRGAPSTSSRRCSTSATSRARR